MSAKAWTISGVDDGAVWFHHSASGFEARVPLGDDFDAAAAQAIAAASALAVGEGSALTAGDVGDLAVLVEHFRALRRLAAFHVSDSAQALRSVGC